MSVESAVEKLRRFVELESKLSTLIYLKLVFKPYSEVGLMHIAMERETAYISVFKVGDRIYIPLSSVLGALRAVGESIAKGLTNSFADPVEKMFAEAHCELEEDTIRHICSPLGGGYIDFVKDLLNKLKGDRSLYKHFLTDEALREVETIVENAKQLMDVPRALEVVFSPLCPICNLFGGPGVESKISILRIEPEIMGIHNITRASISKQSLVALPGHLFTHEHAVIKKLSVDLIIKNIRRGSIEQKLLKALLSYLATIGISVGGLKSVGIGRYVLDSDESKGGYIDLNGINEKKELLDALINIETKIQKSLKNLINELG